MVEVRARPNFLASAAQVNASAIDDSELGSRADLGVTVELRDEPFDVLGPSAPAALVGADAQMVSGTGSLGKSAA